MDRFATWLSIILLACIAGGTMWFSEKTRRDLLESLPKEATNDPDYIADNFTVIRSDASGKPVVRLTGTQLIHTPLDEKSVMQKPSALSIGADRPRAMITADSGVGLNEMQTIELKGNVRYDRAPYKTSQPMNMRTSALTLLPDEDVVTTDQPFRIESGAGSQPSVIVGKDLRLDNVKQTMLIKGQSRATLTPRSAQPAAPKPAAALPLTAAPSLMSTLPNRNTATAPASGVTLR